MCSRLLDLEFSQRSLLSKELEAGQTSTSSSPHHVAPQRHFFSQGIIFVVKRARQQGVASSRKEETGNNLCGK